MKRFFMTLALLSLSLPAFAAELQDVPTVQVVANGESYGLTISSFPNCKVMLGYSLVGEYSIEAHGHCQNVDVSGGNATRVWVHMNSSGTTDARIAAKTGTTLFVNVYSSPNEDGQTQSLSDKFKLVF